MLFLGGNGLHHAKGLAAKLKSCSMILCRGKFPFGITWQLLIVSVLLYFSYRKFCIGGKVIKPW